MGTVFDPRNNLRIRQALEERVHVILTWVYSTLVNVSGIMNPSQEKDYPPMPQGRTPKHMMGFFFPRKLATLMHGETKDLMPVLSPALYPSFEILTTLLHPTQPLRLVSLGNNSCSIVAFVNAFQVDTLEEKIAAARGSLSFFRVF